MVSGAFSTYKLLVVCTTELNTCNSWPATEVPTSSSVGDLRVMIVAKLHNMDHGPSNVQQQPEIIEPPGSCEMSCTPVTR